LILVNFHSASRIRRARLRLTIHRQQTLDSIKRRGIGKVRESNCGEISAGYSPLQFMKYFLAC
jgi:hypothetical protein